MTDSDWTKLCLGLSIGLIMVGTNGMRSRYANSPANVRMISDLNKDGIHDAYVEQNSGRKVPMFGTKDGEYLSADEFKERNPDTIIDYDALEERLNENAN